MVMCRGSRAQLNLQNEVGQSASGSFDSKRKITTNWDGNVIHGTISPDGNRIDWDNRTHWIRIATKIHELREDA